MKVLHINSYFSGSGFYKNLYDKQVEYGLDLDVFVPVSFSFDLEGKSLGDYTLVSANHGKYDRAFFHLKHNKIYKDAITKYKIREYNLIHAHSLFSNGYIALKLKQKFNIPYVVAVRNTDVNTFFKYMIHLRNLGIQILKEAHKVIFLSESYRIQTIDKYVPDRIKDEILSKSEVIPNGIDDFWFQNKGLPREIKNKGVKLLYVGAVNKNKNLLTTVKAIKMLRKKGIDATYSVVGKIEDHSVYREISKSKYVSYSRPRGKEDLIYLYRKNDIFIMPSITETFGLVYAEAMSQGLPVIYSKGQGFDGHFKEGLVGYHTNSTNESEMADRISDIISNYNVISSNCLNKVDKFNWSNIVSEYNKLYTDIKVNQ